MHARFEETNAKSGKCTKLENSRNQCFGGFARVAYTVKKYRELAKQPGGKPVLFLNAGDTYTGTPWFTVFKHNITAAFLNEIHPDTMSLGNHELDNGVEGLIPFLDNIKFPVVTSNLNLNNVPELAKNENLRKSVVFTINNVKIGVIGYLTPDTKFLTYPNKVDYYSEIDSINLEAKELKKMGVPFLIALGHSGFKKDREIALKCPDIDLVIGGHTNTFLYNGAAPSLEIPEGLYPTVIQQKSGKKVPVVQAYAYTKYLGYLEIEINPTGKLVSWVGQPILLNYKVPEDSDVLGLLEVYRPNITALYTTIIGETFVDLEGNAISCRSEECNLGNVITDAMIYARLIENRRRKAFWTDTSISFLQGGGIRSSITKNENSSILLSDIMSVLPFNNQLYIIEVSGFVIKRALEHSASLINSDSNGGFLQMSGIYVQYDLSKPIGDRTVYIKVRCTLCSIPKYKFLNINDKYKIILNSFLLSGGDGHNWREPNEPETTNIFEKAIAINFTEQEALSHYIKDKSPIYTGSELRILFKESNDGTYCSRSSEAFLTKNLLSASIILILFKEFF